MSTLAAICLSALIGWTLNALVLLAVVSGVTL